MNTLRLNCDPLDELLGEGLESGIITKIYGETGTGKTNICLQAAIECAKAGNKVAYIDTEGVSSTRFEQIAQKYHQENIIDHIMFFTPTSFAEQQKAVTDAINLSKVKLIIIDSINLYYRMNLEDDQKERTMRTFARQVATLQTAARKHKFIVLITEQVYTDKSGEIRPFTNWDTEHFIKTVLKVEKQGPGKRKAILMKHRAQPEGLTTCFAITGSGLDHPDQIITTCTT